MSDAEELRCPSTHEVVTYFGPTFEVHRTEFFQCIREPEHTGNFHFGPPIDGERNTYATWPVEAPNGQ
jgi:hypothetical protein